VQQVMGLYGAVGDRACLRRVVVKADQAVMEQGPGGAAEGLFLGRGEADPDGRKSLFGAFGCEAKATGFGKDLFL
jgi:hypothetical protein